jgi:predicted AAA+ superfamily ATPase
MWIQRDFLQNFTLETCLEAIFLKGPRQIGKTSLLERLKPELKSTLYLDDLSIREKATKDPEFVLSTIDFPVLIDEAHLAPPLFYSIKKRIDESRRNRLEDKKSLEPASIRLTGSNLIDINTSVQETLAGRVNIFYLHGLSWNEIHHFSPETKIDEYFFKGGFPELWIRNELNVIEYINDYISNFIEKDLARSIGIEKRLEFTSILKLCAARVGELLNYESLGNDAGVKGKTVKNWLSLLEENKIIYILRPYASNLNERLIKMPKIYYMDTGICCRLQNHQSKETILHTPQAGHLFENLVVSEIIKTKDHFRLDLNIFFWRTKDKEEIDLILENQFKFLLIEVKLGSKTNAQIRIPKALQNTKKEIKTIVVTASGIRHYSSREMENIPINDLVPFLLSYF